MTQMNSITYKVTPHKDLQYIEVSSTFDAELHISDETWNQEKSNVPAELVTGPELYDYPVTLHSSRTISKDLALRALR